VPLGEASFPQLEAPGGPLGSASRPGPSGAEYGPCRSPTNPSSAPDLQPGLFGAQGRRSHPASLLPGLSGTQGGRRNNQKPQPGPSGAQGGYRRPPPSFQDFVDLTADVDAEEDMGATPATPFPNVSEEGNDDGSAMATDDEEWLLAYTGQEPDSESSNDGFEHV